MSTDPKHSDSLPPRKPREQSWPDWIEDKIQEAMRRGEFDNLPGQGKPLRDRRNPFAPADRQLAHDLIQDSGHTLPWLGDGKEVERRIEAARRQLRQDYDWCQSNRKKVEADSPGAIAAIWAQKKAAFAQGIGEINRLIDTYNLKTPSPQFHKFRLILAEEYRALE